MKSAEMANESNVINMRNQRSSGRPSVAAKMSQLANNSGDISYVTFSKKDVQLFRNHTA